MAHSPARQVSIATARRGRRAAWPLYAALLCAHGCFMEGYGLDLDAGRADRADRGEPPSRVPGGALDAGDALDGDAEAQTREPIGDGSAAPAMDGAVTRVDSGREASANDAAGRDDSSEMDVAGATPAAGDASDDATVAFDAGDASRDAGFVHDSGAACSAGTTCAPQCNASPCALDCADAGTCSVTCQAGQTCNIDCANAGSCNVVCQAGAVCHTQCTNIQFCSIDCQPGANCRNTCTTGLACGFTPFCTQGYKGCGQIAACGDDAGC